MKKLLWFISIFFIAFSCSENKEKITIQGENSSNLQAMQKLKSEYEKRENINLDFKPNAMEDAFNKANQDFANKTGLYDIVLQYNFSLSSFVKNDYVYKLDALKAKSSNVKYSFENDLFQNVWKEVGYYYRNPKRPKDDSIEPIAYPFSANTMILVYNKELFNDPNQKKAYFNKYNKELTVPRDMKTFKQVAEFFTQPEKDLKGVCLQGSTGGWLYYEFCNFLQNFGGKVMDKKQGWQGTANTRVLLDSPEAIKATQFYLSLKPYNSGNFSTTDGVEQKNLIKKGKVAMGMIWSDYIWGLIDEGNGKFDKRFGFAPGPGNKSMIAGGSFYINKQSKKSEAAFKYIQYLLEKESQVKLIKMGLCSPLKSAYDDVEAKKIPYVTALKEALERADYMIEAGPDADMINNIITKYLQKAWNNQLSVDNALNSAKTEIENERKNLYK